MPKFLDKKKFRNDPSMVKTFFQHFSCLPSFSNQKDPDLEKNLANPFLKEKTQSDTENTSNEYDPFTPIIKENWATASLESLLKIENPNVIIKNGHTPLSLAAELGKKDMVRILLEHNADPNMRIAFDDHTPLTLAAFSRHTPIVEILLNNPKTDINLATSNGSTPLAFAAAVESIDIVRLLLDKGVDPNRAQSDNTTPLMVAAKTGNTEIVERLLKEKSVIDKIDITSKNSGYTALMEATSEGHEEVVNLLLASGANPNIITSITSPLILAIKNRIIAETLLKHGADPTHLNNSALLYAIQQKKTDSNLVTLLLLKYGADPNNFEGTDLTPLMLAILNHAMPIFYALVNNEAVDVNKAKTDGTTALILAVEIQDLVMVRALAKHEKIEIDKEKSDGTTALMLAVQTESLEIAKTLVEHKANINSSTDLGSVIGFAHQSGNEELYNYLLPLWTKSFQEVSLR